MQFVAMLLLVFLIPAISAFLGGWSGYVVGIFFDDTIRGIFERFGVDLSGFGMFHLGVFLGFVGGFFRSAANVKSS